ncbi:cytochrome P450 [Coprinopsis marcescibilis]|uniref:Cytochrome P450 n=1 Tax=Coprinopsis marcescibilis TaxID=230819 RepID=A0A5C3KRD8_COPMA|nr:cytochrome P450 [Coprinopsis marcescibilis]
MMSTVSALGIVLAGVVVHRYYTFSKTRSKLKAIPTVGSDNFVTAYLSAWRFFLHAPDMVQEGYDKYYGNAFKVPTLETSSGWMVIVSGEKMIEELKNAPNSELDHYEATKELLQLDYTFGKYAHRGTYHNDVIRTGFTRALAPRYSDICDELVESFDTIVPRGKDWVPVPLMDALVSIICRVSNRLMVGAPLCRDPEFQAIQTEFAMHVMLSAGIVHLCPSPFKPFVGSMVSKVPHTIKRLHNFLGAVVDERLKREAELGKRWEGRPNDMISWLLDHAPAEYADTEDIVHRIMIISFAAVHTTASMLTNSILQLAAHSEYVEPLRLEIEKSVEDRGWSKEALAQMRKLDSFVRESARLSGLNCVSAIRKAKSDFTFSNGVTIPAGVTVAAASYATHRDFGIYEDALSFKGFRFSDLRENGTDEMDWLRYQFVNTQHNYLPFGHGKHACPGRFVAATQIKTAMAHILLNYDLKLPDGQVNPPDGEWFGTQRVVSSKAQILFRQRHV